MSPDPEKVQAIQEFKRPNDVTELRWFLGIVNQLSKFAKNISDITKPLRELLSKNNQWFWGTKAVKLALSSTPILALYDPNRPTQLSADAF